MLSEAVCTTPMCKDGRAAVAKMQYTLTYLRDNYSNFNYNGFKPAVDTIQAELDAIDSWYADLIPFNPTCCTIDEVGQQADILSNQMLSSVGAANIPAPPPGTDWGSVILIGSVAVLLVVYSPQVKTLFKK